MWWMEEDARKDDAAITLVHEDKQRDKFGHCFGSEPAMRSTCASAGDMADLSSSGKSLLQAYSLTPSA